MGRISLEISRPQYAEFNFDDDELAQFVEYYAERGIDEQEAIWYFVLTFVKEADSTDFTSSPDEYLSYDVYSREYDEEGHVFWDGTFPPDL